MTSFTLDLQSPLRCERFDDVVAFKGADATGSFSLWARHERFVTVLEVGLCSARMGGGREMLIALPGAVAYFAANELRISTRYYRCGDDPQALIGGLRTQMNEDRIRLRRTREAIDRLERELLRQLWHAGREGHRLL